MRSLFRVTLTVVASRSLARTRPSRTDEEEAPSLASQGPSLASQGPSLAPQDPSFASQDPSFASQGPACPAAAAAPAAQGPSLSAQAPLLPLPQLALPPSRTGPRARPESRSPTRDRTRTRARTREEAPPGPALPRAALVLQAPAPRLDAHRLPPRLRRSVDANLSAEHPAHDAQLAPRCGGLDVPGLFAAAAVAPEPVCERAGVAIEGGREPGVDREGVCAAPAEGEGTIAGAERGEG